MLPYAAAALALSLALVLFSMACFAKPDIPVWPEHPAFGPLNREQSGVMVWKHLDHHLRQFGV